MKRNSASKMNIQGFHQFGAQGHGSQGSQPASSLYRSNAYSSSFNPSHPADDATGAYVQKSMLNSELVGTGARGLSNTMLNLVRQNGPRPSITHDPQQEEAIISMVNSIRDTDVNLFSSESSHRVSLGVPENFGAINVATKPALYGEYRIARPLRADVAELPQTCRDNGVNVMGYRADAPRVGVPPRHPDAMCVELSDLVRKAAAKQQHNTEVNPLYIGSMPGDTHFLQDQSTFLYGRVRDHMMCALNKKDQMEVVRKRGPGDVQAQPTLGLYPPMKREFAMPAAVHLVGAAAPSVGLYGDRTMEERPVKSVSEEGVPNTAESAQTDVMLDCAEELDGSQDNMVTELAAYGGGGSFTGEGQPRMVPLAKLTAVPPFWSDHSSPKALAQANKIMSQIHIPGGIRYSWVHEDNVMYQLGTRWGFTASAITLGSSYFQRLLQSISQLEQAVRSNAKYRDYVAHMDGGRGRPMLPPSGAPDSGPQSVQFACIYIAAKVVDQIPALEMLRYMLSKLYGTLIPRQHASEVEGRCLDELQWRLGPFFSEDDLSKIEGLDQLY